MARRSKLNELVIMTRDVKETYLKVIKDEFIDVIELKSRCVQPNAVGPTTWCFFSRLSLTVNCCSRLLETAADK